MGVEDDAGNEPEEMKVGEAKGADDAADPFENAPWVTEQGRREFEELMQKQGVDAKSEVWHRYARRFLEEERARRGPDAPEDDEEEMLQRSGVFDDDEEFEPGGAGNPERDSIRGTGAGSARGYSEPIDGRAVRTTRPPDCLSEKECMLHRVTHYPYRSWCPCCRARRGIASQHRRGGAEVDTGAEFHFDYCFLRNRPSSEAATTLVGVDRLSGGVLAHVVPHQGTRFEWAAACPEQDVKRFWLQLKAGGSLRC